MLNNCRRLSYKENSLHSIARLHKAEFLYIVFFLGKTHQLTRMLRRCNTDILDNQRLEPQRWHPSVMSMSMKYFIDRYEIVYIFIRISDIYLCFVLIETPKKTPTHITTKSSSVAFEYYWGIVSQIFHPWKVDDIKVQRDISDIWNQDIKMNKLLQVVVWKLKRTSKKWRVFLLNHWTRYFKASDRDVPTDEIALVPGQSNGTLAVVGSGRVHTGAIVKAGRLKALVYIWISAVNIKPFILFFS